ncbi:Uu.00g072920.m01.CDS01 [Anthostomella pinea]|uniref:Uu.00g072920.m01.CDS01 n=1 Tax=Anthostomella pinea TaxID=933095 RepID=A0AAI8VV53_9PEZI|nr:Uu.00g072920.m01.CDS01 [Anthostomella pinea]
MDDKARYERWTKDSLVARILALEDDLRARDHPESVKSAPAAAAVTQTGEVSSASSSPQPLLAPATPPAKKKPDRKIDPSKYSTRLVALKLAYVGKNYGGFEFQASGNLPTIEEELWKAFVKACLIFPERPNEVRFDDWEYSKCGRTDRGVSAFGQVIAIRVRSLRPLPKKKAPPPAEAQAQEGEETSAATSADAEPQQESLNQETPPEEVDEAEEREFNDFTDEIQYPRILNRLLPPDIRILAWCPTTPADFSARFDCRERQYRYFFTQPAYSPVPRSLENPKSKTSGGDRIKDGWLDIDAMRAAAKKFEGLHDFRNFCKVDPGKMIVNFDRRIFESDIVEVKDVNTALPYLDNADFRPAAGLGEAGSQDKDNKFPKVYYFHVRGSAFLWHQIRCMVAVLFSVGQGLEAPSVVDQLLDVAAQPRRFNYVLASEAPLVLWDCIFPLDGDANNSENHREDAVPWVYLGEENPLNQHGHTGLVDQMWEFWRERKIDEVLAGQLFNAVAARADISLRRDPRAPRCVPVTQRVFEGGHRERLVGKYVPMLQKSRLMSPDEVYEREARRKGFASVAELRAAAAQKRADALARAAVEGDE